MAAFRTAVLDHYRECRRDLPWRRTRDPYRILVSEVMLQQTQVARVVNKYEEFISAYPKVQDLAAAPLRDVLHLWQGLGYNRRALALQRTAQTIVEEHHGLVPQCPTLLRSLPGVGPSTAAAVCVFAYDLPLPFIETNIRSAFLHFFFQECTRVSDAEILPLVELTLDCDNPRDWYFALMDYGVWVKRNYGNPSRRSKHYTQQAPFAGSRRQLRAQVLRLFTDASPHSPPGGMTSPPEPLTLDIDTIQTRLPTWDAQLVRSALSELTDEGFLMRQGDRFRIA